MILLLWNARAYELFQFLNANGLIWCYYSYVNMVIIAHSITQKCLKQMIRGANARWYYVFWRYTIWPIVSCHPICFLRILSVALFGMVCIDEDQGNHHNNLYELNPT